MDWKAIVALAVAYLLVLLIFCAMIGNGISQMMNYQSQVMESQIQQMIEMSKP